MYKIGYVILHYISEKDTKECVDSILKYTYHQECYIVIVDNCSPNNSGERLAEQYKENSKIKTIINKKNIGFSKGNNVGIKYARDKLKCDFVVVLNNDTYLMNDEFEKILLSEYKYSGFAVLGPKIYDPSGLNSSNPGNVELPSLQECDEGIYIWIQKLIKALVVKWKSEKPVFNGDKNTEKICNKNIIDNRREFCRLHGCCLVLSPNYFEYFDGFVERTFMYAEETILLINLRKKGLKSVYNPQLAIFHKEAVVSQKLFNGNMNYKKCWLMLKASIALKKEMREYLRSKND